MVKLAKHLAMHRRLLLHGCGLHTLTLLLLLAQLHCMLHLTHCCQVPLLQLVQRQRADSCGSVCLLQLPVLVLVQLQGPWVNQGALDAVDKSQLKGEGAAASCRAAAPAAA